LKAEEGYLLAGGVMTTQIVRFDWAMKTILRDKANFEILEGFLSALLEEDVEILEILESEANQENSRDKYNRVDLMVKGIDDIRYIIEIQTEYEYDYLERLLYGTSKTIVENLKLGEPYRNIKKVISISILFFNLGKGDDYLYKGTTEFIGMTTHEKLNISQKEMLDEMKFKFTRKSIFPEYYLVQTQRFSDKINKDIDEWIYAFKNNKVEQYFKSKNINALRDKLNILNMTEKEKKQHDKYLENLAVENDMLSSAYRNGALEERKKAQKEIDEAKKEKEKALQREKEALQREKEVKKEKEIMIINMLKSGLSIEQVAEISGVSIQEINKFI
jgi:predicted transposase/invertase (TIGR01784 family)